MTVVLDEDIPRSFGDALKEFGFEVFDVRDYGLRSASDEAVFHFAVQKKALLLTADLGYTQPLHFNLHQVRGLILNRLPETLSLTERLNELRRLLATVSADEFNGRITVFEVGRLRRRSIR